jgi:hypothetical protein
MFKKELVYLVFLVLLTSSVLGVGISSGGSLNYMVDYEPGKVINQDYILVADHSSGLKNYDFTIEGEFSEYVEVVKNRELKQFLPGRYNMAIVLTMPQTTELDSGLYPLKICFAEGSSGSTDTVSAKAKTCALIRIRLLSDGKLLKSSLDIDNINVNQSLVINLKVENWGKEKINQVNGIVTIYDDDNNVLNQLSTKTIALLSAQNQILTVGWENNNLIPGTYLAKSITKWDGQETVSEKEFSVGSKDLDLIDYTKKFNANSVNEFKLLIESKWNNPINNIYAEVQFPNQEVKTPNTNIRPWRKTELSSYWNPKGIKTGFYNASVKLSYEGLTKTFPITIEVVESTTKSKEVNLVEEQSSNKTVVILVVIVLINLILWFFWKKKKEQNNEEYDEDF